MNNWEFLIKELVEFLELKEPNDEIIICKHDFRENGDIRYFPKKNLIELPTKRLIENGEVEGHSLW